MNKRNENNIPAEVLAEQQLPSSQFYLPAVVELCSVGHFVVYDSDGNQVAAGTIGNPYAPDGTRYGVG